MAFPLFVSRHGLVVLAPVPGVSTNPVRYAVGVLLLGVEAAAPVLKVTSGTAGGPGWLMNHASMPTMSPAVAVLM
jgi:hypothetical protein